MKRIALVFLFLGLLSCEPYQPNCGKWKLYVSNGWSGGVIICDSINMTSDTTAIVWIKGQKSKVFSPRMMPSYIPCK